LKFIIKYDKSKDLNQFPIIRSKKILDQLGTWNGWEPFCPKTFQITNFEKTRQDRDWQAWFKDKPAFKAGLSF
jgi:hypothetical protein